jgi:hypothetical protein
MQWGRILHRRASFVVEGRSERTGCRVHGQLGSPTAWRYVLRCWRFCREAFKQTTQHRWTFAGEFRQLFTSPKRPDQGPMSQFAGSSRTPLFVQSIDRTLHEIRCFAIKARRDCAAISSQDAVSHADTVEGHSNEVSSCMIWFFVLLVFTMTECIPARGFLASANSIPLHRGGNSKCRTEKSLSSPEHRLA